MVPWRYMFSSCAPSSRTKAFPPDRLPPSLPLLRTASDLPPNLAGCTAGRIGGTPSPNTAAPRKVMGRRGETRGGECAGRMVGSMVGCAPVLVVCRAAGSVCGAVRQSSRPPGTPGGGPYGPEYRGGHTPEPCPGGPAASDRTGLGKFHRRTSCSAGCVSHHLSPRPVAATGPAPDGTFLSSRRTGCASCCQAPDGTCSSFVVSFGTDATPPPWTLAPCSCYSLCLGPCLCPLQGQLRLTCLHAVRANVSASVCHMASYF